MQRVADFYYEMSDRELWLACQAGDAGAAVALIERHDGIPPGEGTGRQTRAAIWAAILAGAADPVPTRAAR